MCLAVPAKITSLDGDFAFVNFEGLVDRVNIQLIEEPGIEDYVLIHAGYAIQKIDKDYYNFLKKFLKEILDNGD